MTARLIVKKRIKRRGLKVQDAFDLDLRMNQKRRSNGSQLVKHLDLILKIDQRFKALY